MVFEFSDEEREAFFEQHFDCEAENSLNKEVAERIFKESEEKVTLLTEQLGNGELVDEPTMVFELSNMILANKYRKIFS